RRVNKSGEPWAICVVEDIDAALEVLFFPRVYALLPTDLAEDDVVVVSGRVNWREDKMAVFGDELSRLELETSGVGGATPLRLSCREGHVDAEWVAELK